MGKFKKNVLSKQEYLTDLDIRLKIKNNLVSKFVRATWYKFSICFTANNILFEKSINFK